MVFPVLNDSARARLGGSILCLILLIPTITAGQSEPEIDRPGPPEADSFEVDSDGDGVPDGWYNARDAKLSAGGQDGKNAFRFANDLVGRPSRASRAFGLDGRSTRALELGVWVKVEGILLGERVGEEPGLMIDLFDAELRPVRRWRLGPWSDRKLGSGWVRIADRMDVPESARDAILTVGLYGATGSLELDDMSFRVIPRDEPPTTNLILNGSFEWGDPGPRFWETEGQVQRIFPGRDSYSALELNGTTARARAGIAVPLTRVQAVDVRLQARATGLRGTGGAIGDIRFFDADGRSLPGTQAGARPFRWGGSFDWRAFRAVVPVPSGASWGVIQFEKSSAGGRLGIDDVEIQAAPTPEVAAWRPFQVAEETRDWKPYVPAEAIEPGSALDASFLLGPAITADDRLVIRDGRFHNEKGDRTRFFGVDLLPPAAFLSESQADALAERLARSGINMVRMGGLDAPLGPGLGLLDDSRDDTQALDPLALARFEHLIAALKARGIRVALEFQGQRRFRAGDQLADSRELPPGGGPAAAFDAEIGKRALDFARLVLGHVNPETGLALKEDPVLGWVTMAGELSLFDLIDDPGQLPRSASEALVDRIRSENVGTGRRAWQIIEGRQWQSQAAALREFGLDVPMAGSSHWRREPEFNAAQHGEGLDFIDDRLYWFPPRWGPPNRRSMLWDPSGGILTQANRKRRGDRPYVVGEWASFTAGAWALPYEAADFLLVAARAAAFDWDALVRRGVAISPAIWGASASGTGGLNDLVVVPEVLNGTPSVFALLPHAASIYMRPGGEPPRIAETAGRVAIETPHTQALAGWIAGRSLESVPLRLDAFTDYAVLAVSSLNADPLGRADRLLVTCVGRAQPTDLTWTDHWRREVANAGSPPILMEPVRARLTWKRTGLESARAFALDNAGHRVKPIELRRVPGGVQVDLDGGAVVHWELVAADH